MIDIPDSIYPKDAQGNALCPRCKKLVAECDCPFQDAPRSKSSSVKPVVRLDKSDRRGKIVTLIGNLPRDEAYLKRLAKELKTKTGSGGTFYVADGTGIIEIQGDHQKTVHAFFQGHP